MGKLDCTTMAMHPCMEYLGRTKALIAEYECYGVEVPGWLNDQQLRLERRVRDLSHDAKAHELSKIKSLIAANKPADEKMEGWKRRQAALEAELAKNA